MSDQQADKSGIKISQKTPKITVFKKVYWKHAGKNYSGTVRLIMGSHVLIKTPNGEYLVRKSELSTKPLG
jgi:hypothetical protein